MLGLVGVGRDLVTSLSSVTVRVESFLTAVPPLVVLVTSKTYDMRIDEAMALGSLFYKGERQLFVTSIYSCLILPK